MRVPYHRPVVEQCDVDAVVECLRSGWLTTGARAHDMERTLSNLVWAPGPEHVLAVNSCTAALHMALLLHGVGPGDEVITSPITWPATTNVIEHVGATPVFADVLPGDLTIDPTSVRALVTARTKAVIPVHFGGYLADVNLIRDLVDPRIPIIVDAAHALEACYPGGAGTGALGDAVCYSFYANKNMTTGEGGALVLRDNALLDRARSLRLHGITKDAWKRYGVDGYKMWDMEAPGWKYNLSDLQASLGLAQAPRVPAWLAARSGVDSYYRDALAWVPGVRLLHPTLGGSTPAHHLFVVVLEGVPRERALAAFGDAGVGVGVHFPPVHGLQFYRRTRPGLWGTCPVAELAGSHCISLPIYPGIPADHLASVVDVVRSLVGA